MTGVPLYAVSNALLRHRRLLIALPGALVVLALLGSFLLPREYTAESVFLPQVRESGMSRLAGLAAQIGVNVGSPAEGESLELYAELLTSREVLRDAIETRFVFPRRSDSADTLAGTLIELYEVEGDTPAETLREAVRMVEDQISAQANAKTGTVELRTRARWPALAEQLNRRLLTLLDEFNVRRRRDAAAAERGFLEVRVQEAERSLGAAEDALKSFMERNVNFRAPELVFEEARLERRVQLRQDVFASLAQSLEQVRLDEVRNTSVVTVLSAPEESAEKTGPPRLQLVLLALFLGLGAAAGWIVWSEYSREQRSQHPQLYQEFVEMKRSALGRLRSPRS